MKCNLFPTIPAIPITLGRFVMRVCALSSEICDKKDIFFLTVLLKITFT